MINIKGKELTIEEVLSLDLYSKVYVEYKNNSFANGVEVIWNKDNIIGTKNKWHTFNAINESNKYYNWSE